MGVFGKYGEGVLRGKRGGNEVWLLACLAEWVDGPMDGVGGLVCQLGVPGPDTTQTLDGFLARLLGLMGRWIRPRNKGWGVFGYVYLEGRAMILDGFLTLCSCGVD